MRCFQVQLAKFRALPWLSYELGVQRKDEGTIFYVVSCVYMPAKCVDIDCEYVAVHMIARVLVYIKTRPNAICSHL